MKSCFLTLAVCFIGLTGYGQFVASDEYIGGDPANSSYDGHDVIGVDNVFNLTGYSVAQNIAADTIEVRVYGNYFDNIISGNGLLGTEMGDLFVSTDGLAWQSGDDTTLDFFGSGIETTWEYGVQLGTYTNVNNALANQAVQTGEVHAITDPSQIVESYININGYFRDHQEVSLEPQWASTQNPVGSASWFIDGTPNGNFLSVTINDASTLFAGAEKLGFHWTMTCGNDVVEFEIGDITVVPEPATIGLLGLGGMIGLLLVRRRLVKNRK